MKAIILPIEELDNLSLLTTHVPGYLLPIVNKPIVEHLIELLVRNGIRDVIIAVKQKPVETERYFGNGERWGAEITYLPAQECCSIGAYLKRISSNEAESLLCLSGNIVTNLDISGMIKSHEDSSADMTISLQSKTDDSVSALPDTAESINEFSPFIISSEALSQLSLNDKVFCLKQVLVALLKTDLIVDTHSSIYDLKDIQSIEDYCESNKRILNGEFKGIIIQGKQRQDGIWIGRHSRIHPNVKLETPVLIGDCCEIRKDVTVGKYTIIGSNVLVDRDASLEESIIMDNAYIGLHTEIKEAIVWMKYLLNRPRMVKTFVADDFIIGDMARRTMVPAAGNFINKIAASTIFVLFSPVVLLLYLYHLMSPSKEFFVSEERFRHSGIYDLDGNERLGSFNLYSFKCRNRIVKALPGMINIIKGDLKLVGKPSLNKGEIDLITNGHGIIRFDEPFGLFSRGEVEIDKEPASVKEPVRNNINRYSLWKSVKVALNSLV